MRNCWTQQPQHQRRAWATYLGKVEGLARWEILGQIYTGSVSTVGGGSPLVGRAYPAWSNQPGTRSQWVVLVRANGKLLPKGEREAVAWPTWRRGGTRQHSVEQGHIGAGSWVLDSSYPTLIRLGSEGERWDRLGAEGEWESAGPWTLRKNSSPVGDPNAITWHDISITADGLIALTADSIYDAWRDAPDYPLSSPGGEGVSSVLKLDSAGELSWDWPIPPIDVEDPGGDPGGGDGPGEG